MNGSPVPRKPVLLIYSGGLDTSFCVHKLREEGHDPIFTVTCDLGQPRAELRQAEKRAQQLHCIHTTVNKQDFFAKKLILPALWAKAQYGGYLLATALARPVIAQAAVDVAKKHRVRTFAHGCTGKGNDQFRIEYGLRARMPQAEILAPVREGNFTRSEELKALKKYGISFPQKPYSLDENLWGRAIEGEDLEELHRAPKEQVFQWTALRKKQPSVLSVEFQKGVPVALNGKKIPLTQLIATLNEKVGAFGIGRVDVIEDRIIGLKSREVYECPAAFFLYEAHRQLEALVLTHAERLFREQFSPPYAELCYQGLFPHPLFDAFTSFFQTLQRRLSGTVAFTLRPFSLHVLKRSSPHSLYSQESISFESKALFEVGSWLRLFHYDAQRFYAQKK